MVQLVVWSITFLTLWLTLVWLHFIYDKKPTKRVRGLVSIGIPVFSRNHDKDAIKTVKSVFDSGYPHSLLDVIVVDDGSEDDTYKRLVAFKKANPKLPLRVFTKKNGGKSSAVNVAIKRAKGVFFSVMDADSRISKGSIEKSLSNFTDKNVGAVISRIRVDNPKSLLENLQKVEYIMSALVRNVMANFGTLSMTPGVLSIYRMDVLRKLGGFDENRDNLTEDLEIAMRLKANNYVIKMEHESVTYTSVPNSMGDLWRQRIRWTRGYIFNHIKYKKLFFSQKHGIFGMFQMPINVAAVALLVLNAALISFDLGSRGLDFVYRSLTINNYFLNSILDWPTIKEFVLARNVQVTVPLILVFILGAYMWYVAHKTFREPIRQNAVSIVGYLIVMPYFTAANWVSSIAHEVFKTKRKW